MKVKISLFAFICLATILLNSCKKESTPSTPAPTPEELLTKSLWKMDEIRYSQVNTSGGGATYYYKRGVTGNISNLDNESVQFATNNTGTFTIGTTIAPITWQFTNAGKTKIQWVINYGPGNTQTVNWDNVTITASALSYGEYYTATGGVGSIGIATQTH